jgi:hypothetical protein
LEGGKLAARSPSQASSLTSLAFQNCLASRFVGEISVMPR